MVTIEMQKTHVGDICVLFVYFAGGRNFLLTMGLGRLWKSSFCLTTPTT